MKFGSRKINEEAADNTDASARNIFQSQRFKCV